MREIQDVTVETFNIRETGPYTGQRIAGTSGDVVNAVLTQEYVFADRIAIRVIDIPARLDRETGRTYISGHDGKILMKIVRRYTTILREQRVNLISPFGVVPVRMRLHAPDLLAA